MLSVTPPTGTVTFLFTDIEGSTKLARDFPDFWESMCDRHDLILREAIESHQGFIFETLGDSFYAAFHKPREALQAAIKAQIDLQNEPWDISPVRVRMGIHTGEAETDGRDYRGYLTLSLVQRIMSAGHGGQILLSDTTENLLNSQFPTEVSFRDMGKHKLKDISNPVRFFQVVVPDLQSDFPALRAIDVFPNNLPTHLTNFIGREREISEVKQELNEHRLVTLTGSGGTGKTRLSLQVAAELLDSYPNGTWFIELATLTDPDLIPQTILSAIDIKKQQGKTPLELLQEYLHEKQTLILLDNCEHLISASAQVVNALLRAAPQIKILASSREALGIRGEVSYPVPSLAMPDIKHLPLLEQLSQYEAVRLFIDRALLVAPHFVVDKENAPFIAQICHRLDGIPLAIELAAARMKVLSVDQISKRLDDRFRLLTGGARTALPRQQTLRALIDWSYDILVNNEKNLFRRLSVFSGGWSLEAAEDVCSGDGIDSYDILDLLTQLVNKSLVAVDEDSKSSETRYHMLETIRQYARDKLLEAGGGETFRDKHLAYYVELTEQAEPELYRSNQITWLNKLNDEFDNIRRALEWAITTNASSGLRLVCALRFFLETHGNIQEMRNWLEQLLESYQEADSLRAKSLVLYGHAVATLGELTKAQKIISQSLETARSISDKGAEAFSLWGLGVIFASHGDIRNGIPLLEQSLAMYEELDDKLGQALALGWLSLNNNDIEKSKSYLKESLKLSREMGHLLGTAICLSEIAHRMIWDGDLSSPEPLLDEAISIYRQLGNKMDQSYALAFYGLLAHWQGNYINAIVFHEDAIALADEVGDYFMVLWARVNLAYTLMQQGELLKAKKEFEQCVRSFRKTENMIGLVFAIEGIASLYVKQENHASAMRLIGWADAMREKIGDYRPPVEQNFMEVNLAVVRRILSNIEVETLSIEGHAMTMEQAIQLALD